MSTCGCAGDSQHLRNVRERQTGKIPQLYELGLLGILAAQFVESFVDREQFIRIGTVLLARIIAERLSFELATVLDGSFSPCVIDQDSSHRLGSRGKKVAAIGPLLLVVAAHQFDVRFMDEGGALERLPGGFMTKFLARQRPQLVIHQGQQLVRSQ